MLKKGMLLVAAFFLFASVNAFTTQESEFNSTLSIFSIEDAVSLYAYEVNLDYTGTIGTVTQANFLGPTSQATYGSNQKNNILSVYGSLLNSTHPGVNGAGQLFNVSYSGGVSLRYTLAVLSDGTEVYTYYNTTGEPVVETGGGSSRGTGGGGAPSQFDVTPSTIKINVGQGQTTTQTVRITNRLNTALDISSVVIDESIKRFIALEEDSVYLMPGESRDFNIEVFARANEVPEVYIGRISFTGGVTTKSVNLIIEVGEDKPLFDVTVDLERTEYAPGENVIAVIEVENFGELKDIDVLLYYAVKDFQGNVLAFKEESYAIENYKLQIIGKLKLPKDMGPEDYFFYTKATYGDVIATGSQVFSVRPLDFSPFSVENIFLFIVIPVVVLVVVVLAIILYFNTRKKKL